MYKPTPFVIPIFIPHAGCPHRCVFCNQTCTTSHSERLPTADQLEKTIIEFLSYRKDAGRYTEISFYGGNFLGLPLDSILFLLESASRYIHERQVQGIRFSTRPDTIDEQRLKLLTPFPVTTIELGVQSMNNKVLAITRRGHTVEDIYDAVSLLGKQPYRLGLQMMVGLPGDTPELAMATGTRIAGLAPDFVRIYPTLVLRGSLLARWYRQARYTPMNLNDAVALVKSLYCLFALNGIKVIRMGLQATDGLQMNTDMVAGPFHPAFGELVYSALWLDAMRKKIHAMSIRNTALEIQLHPKLLSRIKGHHNHNRIALSQEFSLPSINFSMDRRLDLDLIRINGQACHLFQ
jgi:histone acetyltransferase (RNA polymerase elongator complex component)